MLLLNFRSYFRHFKPDHRLDHCRLAGMQDQAGQTSPVQERDLDHPIENKLLFL
jgi:hypothetical protein